MSGGKWMLAAAACAGAVVGAAGVMAMNTLPGAGSRSATEAIVRDYVLDHPEIIQEAQQRLIDRATGRIIAANRDAVLKPFAGAWAGNPAGDVTVVEYFDYNCGYCRASLPVINELIARDPKVRVVFRELPVLSEESRVAAKVSLIAAEQGKFDAFHQALYAGGPVSQASIDAAARRAGLDPASVGGAATEPRLEREIASNLAIAGKLGVTGTPAWVIGDRVISSALPVEELLRAVTAARERRGS